MSQKPFKASYSKIRTFKKCQHQFWLTIASKYVTGKEIIPYADTPQTLAGKERHGELEHFTVQQGDGKGTLFQPKILPPTPLWQTWWGDLIRQQVTKYPEFATSIKIGLDHNWRGYLLGDYYVPLFVKDAVIWIHGELDWILFNGPRASATYAKVIDWKTGKPYQPEPFGQLALYALFAFSTWPNLQQIDCFYIFVDHKKKKDQTWKRADLPVLQKAFAQMVNDILSTMNRGIYNCSQNKCEWCPATKQHCEYGRHY